MDGIWNNLTPVGLALGMIALVFILLSTGRLYTKRQHDEVVAFYQTLASERKEDKDAWQSVAESQKDQLDVVLPTMKIVGDFFTKVPVTPSSGHNEQVEGIGHGS